MCQIYLNCSTSFNVGLLYAKTSVLCVGGGKGGILKYWVSLGCGRYSGRVLMDCDRDWGQKLGWEIPKINFILKGNPKMYAAPNYLISECCRILKSHFLLRAAVTVLQIMKMCLP